MTTANHLADALMQAGLARPDAPFLFNRITGETTPYGAFLSNARRVARALVRLGVRPGDRVAVQAPKTQAMLELYLGTLLAGGIFLPLNTAYTRDEMAYFLTDAEPALLVCDPDRRAELEPLARKAGTGHILTLAADESGSLVAARDSEPDDIAAAARGPEDIAAILYTSGTTGRPKGAMLPHRALLSNARALTDCWRFGPDDVLIHALPIFHSHGLFVATNVMLLAGGACIWLPRFDAAAVLAEMPRATAMMGVPTFYTRLLERPGLAEAARGMRLFTSGSAPLLEDTHRRWRTVTGHAILERYGLTETNMNTSNPYEGERRPGTVGFPLPGIEVIVTDPETGTPLPRGETGMVEVRGPNLFRGYWKKPDRTAEDMRDTGFFITGDLGRFDADGYLQIVGRKKDLIISGGLNVYPKEVELAIDALPEVMESAVIGVPHPDLGEAVVAVVVPAPGARPTEQAILSAIAPGLARFKQPKAVILADELPRNTMGKVQKALLRKQHAGLFAG